jgi:hypothetical protein
MLVNQDPRQFESNTVNGTTGFTIAASSKAFQILSDQLYTDKPRAILRELSTNALDAHTAAGHPEKPFEVQLPTTWDSTLIVKDYGTGLSREQVESLYTTYFGSDKTHTNDLVGGLGLGSKSPFSYTDQFTAVSRYDGAKYTWAAFIGEDNTPAISLVKEEPTDEANGFEVHVPVKESDIYTFEQTAKRVFEFFEVKPVLNKQVNFIEHKEPVLSLQCDEITCELYDSQDKTVVMQGPIGYPVDSSAVMETKDYYSKERQRAEKFFNKGWRLKAPVGTFEITASREGLSYNKSTIARLRQLMEQVMQKLKAQTVAELRNVTEIGAAAKLLETAAETLTDKTTLKDIMWNGLEWLSEVKGFHLEMPPGVECRMITKRGHGTGHSVDIREDGFLLRPGDYRVMYSEKRRPYKNWLEDNEPETRRDIILYFNGPLAHILGWVKSVGLPAGEEMPKPAKLASTGGTAKKATNYGATKYSICDLTTGEVSSGIGAWTANDILAEPGLQVTLCSDAGFQGLRTELNIFARHQLLNKDIDPIYAVIVPGSHTRVRKAFEEHPGFMTRSTAKAALLKDTKQIVRRMASQEVNLKLKVRLDKKFPDVQEVLQLELIEDPTLLTLIERATAIDKSVSESESAHRMPEHKRRMANALTGLPLFGDSYNRFVDKLYTLRSRELEQLITGLDWLSPVIKDFETATYRTWGTHGKELKTVITEWANTRLALLSTQEQQEAA